MHNVDTQTETRINGDQLLREYNAGRRDFSNLCFETYLDLDNVNLREIDFTNCWLDGSFRYSNLQNANFTCACVKTAYFDGANLCNALFRHAAIDATEFTGANIKNADFENATAHSHTFSAGELPLTT